MFPTSSSARQAQAQRESPPPDGADSFYGVRSLNSSVEWGGGSERSEPARARTLSDNMKEKIRVFEGQGTPARSARLSGTPEVEGSRAVLPGVAEIDKEGVDDPSVTSVEASGVDELELQPHSFGSDKTLASLPHTTQTMREASASASGLLPSLGLQERDESPSYDPRRGVPHLDTHVDTYSEPSSPASFTSLPSYGASISSMSRTSSPVAGLPDFRQHVGPPEGSDELVLPRLSLPSTSLHMSLRRWEGQVEAVKIALVGNRDKVREVLKGLDDKEELVEVARNEVGVVRHGKIAAVLISPGSIDQLKERVTRSYQTLDKLLHPSPDQASRDNLSPLIASWTSSNEWLHAAFCLTGSDEEARRLSGLIPLTAAESIEGVTLLPIPSADASSRSPTPSPQDRSDPTPMLRVESQNYFDRAHASGIDSTARHASAAAAVQSLIENTSIVQNASTTTFMDWRPPVALESSVSSIAASHESASTMESGTAPMPDATSQVQGAGEWEAMLSRRVAKRRESGNAVYRNKGKRRSPTRQTGGSTSGEKDCGPPLFRKSSGGSRPSRPSFLEMAAETFAPILGAIKGTAWVWRRTLVSCAVVLAVGTLGYGVWRNPSFKASISIMIKT